MKTGLFFGSFNPVHVGHMVLANYMLEFTDLERLWFIVSPHNPLKKKNTLLDERHRFQLVSLAIGENNRMKASEIEFRLPQPSYTINTLAYLEEKYPEQKFVLILGADNLETFHKWKNYEQILARHELYVYPRPGYPAEAMMKHPNIKAANAPLMEISSTFLRKAILEKKNVAQFFPASVWEYIREMHFYEKE